MAGEREKIKRRSRDRGERRGKQSLIIQKICQVTTAGDGGVRISFSATPCCPRSRMFHSPPLHFPLFDASRFPSPFQSA